MAEQIRVAVIDDHPLLREGVVHTLSGDPGLNVVAEGACANDAIRISQSKRPHILLMDVSMPGGGIEAALAVKTASPLVKIIMLTVSEREDDLTAAMTAGVQGYVLKGIGGSELVRVVRAVMAGETYVSPGLAARMLVKMQQRWTMGRAPKDRDAELTAREGQILSQASLGLSNKEIGNKLQLSEKTVKHYMTNVLQKLQVRNRVEAILAAQRQGMVDIRQH